MKVGKVLYVGAALVVAPLALGLWHPFAEAQGGPPVPQYKVDPFWPKPLPTVKDADGQSHAWITGEVGATCIDSHDHIITVNRSYHKGSLGGILPQEGTTSIPAPPVVVYDPDGNMVSSWGDPTLLDNGGTKVLPNGTHGCFADYQDNIWIAGNADGVVQKWSHDGKTMLLQIGTKGLCDGPERAPAPPPALPAPFPTCGEPGTNTGQTLRNNPADLAVDPNPDPITGQPGSVYIADGYGNHRVVVFDRAGKYLRQFGSPGSGDGQFGLSGGGHPHCVVLGNDNLVYACDRSQNRIVVFDRNGTFQKNIPVNPPDQMKAVLRVTDLAFSPERAQNFLYDVDLGSDRIWILNRLGVVLAGIGRPGHQAGELTFPHTVALDSKGNVYVSETINGRRSQKFVKVAE